MTLRHALSASLSAAVSNNLFSQLLFSFNVCQWYFETRILLRMRESFLYGRTVSDVEIQSLSPYVLSIHLSRGPKGEIRFMVRGRRQMNSCISETTAQSNKWGHISVQKLNKVGIALGSQHTDKSHQNKDLLIMSLNFGTFCVLAQQPTSDNDCTCGFPSVSHVKNHALLYSLCEQN